MKRELFSYNRFLEPICEKITKHKYKELVLWQEKFVKGGYKYPNRHDFYYKCKICGYVYFNHSVSEEDLEYIKRIEKEQNNDIDKK